jgi:hypothetical protein
MKCSDLAQWLWSKLIQKELDDIKLRFNSHPVRHDYNKMLPSGVLPNVAMATYQEYGATYCLQKVKMDIIRAFKQELGGDMLVRFVLPEFVARCQAVFDTLEIQTLSFQNVWAIFSHMLTLVYDN